MTGVLLLVYYRADPAAAHASVSHIVNNVPFGWLVRGVHVAGSHAMIAAVLTHLAFTFATRAFRCPRELTWITGMLLAGMTLALGWSGSVLVWDVRGGVAADVGLQLVAAVPLAGERLAEGMRGGELVGPDTLRRFWVLHGVALPAAFITIALLHLGLVHLHGLAPGHNRPKAVRSASVFPALLVRTAVVWTLALNALVASAALAPPALGPPAYSLQPTPASVLPAWYFMPVYQLACILPAPQPLQPGSLAACTVMAVTFVVASVPWWASSLRGRCVASDKVATIIAGTIALAAAGLGLWAHLQR
jgi:quinol-cytochrome oxidoreductase complex cytochrome b subunit